MKKAYEAPSVEKIAFNYRDQVVAASGDPGDQNVTGGNTTPGLGTIVDYVLKGLGWSYCDQFGDLFG